MLGVLSGGPAPCALSQLPALPLIVACFLDHRILKQLGGCLLIRREGAHTEKNKVHLLQVSHFHHYGTKRYLQVSCSVGVKGQRLSLHKLHPRQQPP